MTQSLTYKINGWSMGETDEILSSGLVTIHWQSLLVLADFFLVLLPIYTETLSSCPVQSSHSLHLCLSNPCQWPGLISSLSSKRFAYPGLWAPKYFLAFPKYPNFELTSETMADHRTTSYRILTLLPKFCPRFLLLPSEVQNRVLSRMIQSWY